MAEIYAFEQNIPSLIIRPDYDRYGKIAPLERNKLIVNAADVIIAIGDGESKGTKHTIDYARKTGKPVDVYTLPRS